MSVDPVEAFNLLLERLDAIIEQLEEIAKALDRLTTVEQRKR